MNAPERADDLDLVARREVADLEAEHLVRAVEDGHDGVADDADVDLARVALAEAHRQAIDGRRRE